MHGNISRNGHGKAIVGRYVGCFEEDIISRVLDAPAKFVPHLEVRKGNAPVKFAPTLKVGKGNARY